MQKQVLFVGGQPVVAARLGWAGGGRQGPGV